MRLAYDALHGSSTADKHTHVLLAMDADRTARVPDGHRVDRPDESRLPCLVRDLGQFPHGCRDLPDGRAVNVAWTRTLRGSLRE